MSVMAVERRIALAGRARSSLRHPLVRFIGLRLLQAIPLIVVVVLINFILIQLAPGDPATLFSREGTTQAQLEHIRQTLGLGGSFLDQLSHYVRGAAHGDFGTSIRYNQSVTSIVLSRLPATLLLSATAIVISTVVGILLATATVRRGNRTITRALDGGSMLAYAIPPFLLGQLLLLAFAVQLGWLPAQGMHSLQGGGNSAIDLARHLILPALAFAAFPLALTFRLTRARLQQVLESDFVLTARSKGLSQRRIVYRHALPNALLSVIAVIGYNAGFMLAGSVLIETVFGWPGLGLMLGNAVLARDFPLILGTFTLTSVLVIFANTLADIAQAALDPRIADGSQ